MSLIEQQLLTVPEHMSSSLVLGIRVAQSLVFCFADHCLFFLFKPFRCMSFDLQPLIIPMESLNMFKSYCYIRCILYVSPKRDSVVVVIVCRMLVVFTITYAVISGYLH